MAKPYAYIIAGTPRTGSNWLCAWLSGCGAGNPREYINRHQLDKWYGVMETSNPPFINALKVFWGHLVNTKETPAEYMRFVWQRMGGEAVRWVYLDRLDIVRQAASLARVRVTGHWARGAQLGPREDVVIPFNPEQIERDIATLQEHKAHWQAFFERHEIMPLEITYEAMQADMQGVVKAVLSHIGVGIYRDVAVPYQKQAGKDVELIVRRYHALESV